MKWVIAPKTRCDIVFLQGLNLSGERTMVQVHPVGGRQGDIDGSLIKSLALMGPLGARIVLCTTEDEDAWEQSPWRAIRLLKGVAFPNREGVMGVRVPDLDWLDPANARRSDPDTQMGFDEVPTLSAGTGWTFGKMGPIRGHVRMIRVDKE